MSSCYCCYMNHAIVVFIVAGALRAAEPGRGGGDDHRGAAAAAVGSQTLLPLQARRGLTQRPGVFWRKALRVSRDLSSACSEANQSAVLCMSWAIQGAVARSCRVSSAASTSSVPRACMSAGRMPRNVAQSFPASGLFPFQPRHGPAQRPGAQWKEIESLHTIGQN